MDEADLTSPRFWESDANHIAANPMRPDDATGLDEFARADLGARGWCFFQTSGSEGRPKWVGLAKEAFLISGREVNEFFQVTSRDRWLAALPLHHVGGFSIYARCFASHTPAIRMTGDWSPESFVVQAAEHEITLASLVPTQVFDLVSRRLPAPQGLRAIIVGGGALDAVLRERALALGWPVCGSYGMTEAASQIATQRAGRQSIDPSSAMEVLPHWRLTTDKEGVLTIRGSALAKGCASRNGGGAWIWHPIDPDVGLRTRDRVRLSQQGGRQFLHFIGRDASFLKICGELVNRDALQRRLDEIVSNLKLAAPAVIVPIDDPRRGVSLVIAVERDRLTSEASARLLEHYNLDSLPFERASRLCEIDEMTRGTLGKIQLGELSKRLSGTNG